MQSKADKDKHRTGSSWCDALTTVRLCLMLRFRFEVLGNWAPRWTALFTDIRHVVETVKIDEQLDESMQQVLADMPSSFSRPVTHTQP